MTNKKRILDWFRYRHFNTNPAMGNHSAFIDVLSMLEGFYGKRLCEMQTPRDSWEEIKYAVKTLEQSQIKELSERIDRIKQKR